MSEKTDIPHDQEQSRIFKTLRNKLLYKKTGKLSSLDLSVNKSIDIENAAIQQFKRDTWLLERSQRLIASNFGKTVKRNKSIHPTSLSKQ